MKRKTLARTDQVRGLEVCFIARAMRRYLNGCSCNLIKYDGAKR